MANESSFTPDWVSPPGDTISAILARRGVSSRDFARQLDRSIDDVEALILGRVAITSELASDLAAILGSTEAFWSRREANYRLGLERLRRESSQNESIEWLREVPVREMIERGWVDSPTNPQDTVEACFKFFGVSSVVGWRESYRDPLESAAFRTSRSFASMPGAVAAWFRRAEIVSSSINYCPWDRDRFLATIPEMRQLSRSKNPEVFIPELVRQCANCGVALVVLRAPEKCRASGACLFLSAGKPLIVLSGRHLTDDHLWFTFFHEAGHLLFHNNKHVFLDDDLSIAEHSDCEEAEANAFAQSVLIPPEHQGDFLRLTANKMDVIRFAVRVGVSRGIIVGQLQHQGRIAQNMLNGLKRRYAWRNDDRLMLSL